VRAATKNQALFGVTSAMVHSSDKIFSKKKNGKNKNKAESYGYQEYVPSPLLNEILFALVAKIDTSNNEIGMVYFRIQI